MQKNPDVFTPENVVHLILTQVGYLSNPIGKAIIDPSCGKGAFILHAAKHLIEYMHKNFYSEIDIERELSNIYGIEVNKSYYTECINSYKKLIESYNLNAKNVRINIFNADTLKVYKKFSNKFDYVVGNPPYLAYNMMNESQRKALKKFKFANYGSSDLYYAFYEIGLELLKQDGILGYISSNSFLRTDSARKMRGYLVRKNLIHELIDSRDMDVFNGIKAYTVIAVLKKDRNPEDKVNTYKLKFNPEDKTYYAELLGSVKYSVHEIPIGKPEEVERILSIENRKYKLSEIIETIQCLRTGKDNVFIIKNPGFDGTYAYIEKKNKKFKIEIGLLKPIIKASLLNNKYDALNKRFIIFPYYYINNKVRIMPEEDVKNLYPYGYKYLQSHKKELLKRSANPKNWYNYGSVNALEKMLMPEPKIITPLLYFKPSFVLFPSGPVLFYSGLGLMVKPKYKNIITYDKLLESLNSPDMDFYIKATSDLQNITGVDYYRFSWKFIRNFSID